MILIALFQALCQVVMTFVKVVLTAGLAFAGVVVFLALICELIGDDE